MSPLDPPMLKQIVVALGTVFGQESIDLTPDTLCVVVINVSNEHPRHPPVTPSICQLTTSVLFPVSAN